MGSSKGRRNHERKSVVGSARSKAGEGSGSGKVLTSWAGISGGRAQTISWFAIKIGPSRYGIFDTFADDSGRDAHLNGQVAKALMQKAAELLAKSPSIEKIDVIASKLPK
jgi:hypothetical protein